MGEAVMLLVLLLLLFPISVWASVTKDAVCTPGTANNGTSATGSCTVNGGATALLIHVAYNPQGPVTLSSVTFDGVAATPQGSEVTNGSSLSSSLWSLSPSQLSGHTGSAHNLVATTSGATWIAVGGISIIGGDTVDPIRTRANNGTLTNFPSNTLHDTQATSFIVDMVATGAFNVDSTTPDSPLTSEWGQHSGGAAGVGTWGASRTTPGGDITDSWVTGDNHQVQFSLELAIPQPPVPPPTGMEIDRYGGATGQSCTTDPNTPTAPVTMTISKVARSGNLVTLTVNETTKLPANPDGNYYYKLIVSGTATDGGSFNTPANDLFQLRTKTATTLVYKQVGADVTEVSDSGTVRLARASRCLVGDRWYWRDPLGYVFFGNAVFFVGPDVDYADYQGISNTALIASKYATGYTTNANLNWALQTVRRMKRWGFNMIGSQAGSRYVYPYNVEPDWPTLDQTIPEHIPALVFGWASKSAQQNWGSPMTQRAKGFSGAVKFGAPNMSTLTGNFVRQIDPFDPQLMHWLDTLPDATEPQSWFRGPNNDYVFGMVWDDGDSVSCTKDGPDYPTYSGGFAETYPGHARPHCGLLTLLAAPYITGQSNNGNTALGEGVETAFPADPTFSAKDELKTWLQQAGDNGPNYANIAALNTAWGTAGYYTTFGSTAVDRTDTICPGQWDGIKKSCDFTFANTPVTPRSIQFTINTGAGDVVQDAGDDGYGPASIVPSNSGVLVGAALSGTNVVDYSTGVGTVTFASPPANGATVKAKSKTGGWGSGTGLLDEDGMRGHNWIPDDPIDICASHANWAGTNCTRAATVTAAFKTDMNNFLHHLIHRYYQNYRDAMTAAAPGLMYLGETNMTAWGGTPRAPAAKAAGEVLDAIPWLTSVQGPFDFVMDQAGDVPSHMWNGYVGNPDSYYSPHPKAVTANTQADRAAVVVGFNTDARAMVSTTHGHHHLVLFQLWTLYDMDAEGSNWGLLTRRDNPYDGKSAAKHLGKDEWGYPTGCFMVGSPSSTAWQASHTYAWRATILDANKYLQTAIVGGQSGAGPGEPAFSTTLNGQTVDNGVTWANGGRASACEQADYGDFIGPMSRGNGHWLNYVTRPQRSGAR